MVFESSVNKLRHQSGFNVASFATKKFGTLKGLETGEENKPKTEQRYDRYIGLNLLSHPFRRAIRQADKLFVGVKDRGNNQGPLLNHKPC